jgi:hypothetical protein
MREAGLSKAFFLGNLGSEMEESRALSLPHPVTAALLPSVAPRLSVTDFCYKKQLGHIAIVRAQLNL